MTENVLQIGPEIIAVVGGILVFLIFALALAIPHWARVLPGSSGHRKKGESTEHEIIRADGYIDTFANQAHEAGGSLPILLMIAIPGVLIWWTVYIIYNWFPR